MSRDGTVLSLDRRRKDALLEWVLAEARAAGARSPQGGLEKTFDFKPYEAKTVLKADASEPLWERMVKHKNGGWRVVLPVMGAVIGHGLDDFVQAEQRRLARERERYAAQERRLAAMAGDMRSLLSVVIGGSAEPAVRDNWLGGEPSGDVGDGSDQESPRQVDARRTDARAPFMMRREP